MKKYRLIKEYPGSPPLGSRVNECIIDTSQRVYQLRATVCKPPLSIHIVEMQPEFWEEVTTKGYEILTIECKWSSPRRSPGDIIKNQPGNGCEAYNEHCHLIDSVKRLSDGEIFTVGDRCKWQGKGCSDTGIISYITLDNNTIMISNGSCNFHLKFISHIKKPLFTTEDGVDIFPKKDGEFQYWSLKLDNWEISNAPYILNSNKIIPTKTEKLLQCCNELRFSTRQAAEEYVILHKPCLSINDIYNNSKLLKDGVIYQGLRQHVKAQILKLT